jgi:predicted glycogen debranching enzyme
LTASREWLVADGLGGFAMGCADGIRRRRYHGLLLVASPTTEQRFLLVNGVEAWVEDPEGPAALSSHRYAPGVTHPDGASRLATFSADPWPTWTYVPSAGTAPASELLVHELFGSRGHAVAVLRWSVPDGRALRLRVRLLLSGRDWHALHHENAAFRFDPVRVAPGMLRFAPYDGVPPVVAWSDGRFEAAPLWYRQFLLEDDRDRGLDCIEDLASPGVFVWDVWPRDGSATLILTTASEWGGLEVAGDVAATARALAEQERDRLESFGTRLQRSAEAYRVLRRNRRTIIAGYPWFTDWGRDTFVAVRGLCLAAGRPADAEAILLSWCDHLSDGMLPNLFPASGSAADYNSVDASLWFVIAAHELLSSGNRGVGAGVVRRLREACDDILAHYARGTRFGIRLDDDGLLAAGVRGASLALTWMDAVVDGAPVTPRVGKPVDVQALWINALAFASTWDARWSAVAARARSAFATRYWNPQRRCLYDVVDVDHRAGAVDDRVRPNQVFAVGGLPEAVIGGEHALAVVDTLERRLWTPMGLRTLAPDEPGYRGRADGPLHERDRAYHQGTVWPWLSCAFVEAVARARGKEPAAVAAERLAPLLAHAAGRDGHVPEIADGDPPHEPRGCPFQAWSVGELIRATVRLRRGAHGP